MQSKAQTALKRLDDVQEMFEKRHASLKKVSAKQTRPVQSVAPRPESSPKRTSPKVPHHIAPSKLEKKMGVCWLKCINAVFWYLFVISPLNLYFPEACLYFRFITWRLNAQALYPELFKSKIWMHSSLFNSVLNSTASNRKATDHSCASKQPSDAELAKRRNIRAKAKSGIKVYQFVSFTWSNLK